MGTFRVGVSEGVDGFVSFFAAGEPAVGDFRCSACGYGVSVSRALPYCPMCRGVTWEQLSWPAPARASSDAARAGQPAA